MCSTSHLSGVYSTWQQLFSICVCMWMITMGMNCPSWKKSSWSVSGVFPKLGCWDRPASTQTNSCNSVHTSSVDCVHYECTKSPSVFLQTWTVFPCSLISTWCFIKIGQSCNKKEWKHLKGLCSTKKKKVVSLRKFWNKMKESSTVQIYVLTLIIST